MKKCTKCKVEKEFTSFHKHKKSADGFEIYCKECRKEMNNKYYKDNNQKAREYYKDNTEKIKKYQKKYQKEYNKTRRKIDTLFKLKCYLRNRTGIAFKSRGYTKNTKTQEMLGTDWEVCKMHVQQQFTKGMDWNNYGDWHIDHIVPLGCADVEEELILLCHFTNLQPLWAVDNFAKSNTYIKAINYNKVLNKHPDPEILKAIVNRSQIVILQ